MQAFPETLANRVRPVALVVGLCAAAWAGPAEGFAQLDDTRGPAIDCRAEAPADMPRTPVHMTAAERAQWQRIARQRFVVGDVKSALDEWNRLSGPRVQCVNVDGLVRTRRRSVIDYLGTKSGEVLTSEAVSRLERRLSELPVASSTDLRFDPAPDGSTTITPIVIERSMVPSRPFGWAAVGMRAAILQEIRVPVVSSAGHGEVWTPSYRFSRNRPRGMLRLVSPAPGLLPGLLDVEALAEEQTYRYAALGADVLRQSRYRVAGGLSDWATSWLRWAGSTAFDRIGDTNYVAFESAVSTRALDDRLALNVSAGRWAASGGRASFGTAEAVASARSTALPEAPVLTTLVGVSRATTSAPLAMWPAASSGEGRGALLRAHPLRVGRIITGDAFGRSLVFSTTEYERPLRTRFGLVSVAGFVDAVRASDRIDPLTPSRLHVDIGTGLRFDAMGAGKIRLDIGYGLRDGRTRLSAGFVTPWGTR